MAKSNSPSSPSLISMRELDPSPVESPLSPQSPTSPSEENSTNKDPYSSSFSSSKPAPRSTSSISTSRPPGLNLASTFLALQKYSTIPFTLFLALHITNTSLLPLVTRSLQTSDTYLLLTRPYYQSPLLEPTLILAPLATHILSGVALRLYRRRQAIKRYGADEPTSRADRRRVPWPKLSAQSVLGYALLPLVAGHAFVNRVMPLWVEGGSSGVGLRYVAHGFAKHPVLANVGYAGLVGVGIWHFVGGAARWLGLGEEAVRETGDYGALKRRRRWRVVNGVAAVGVGVWMLGGLGVVGRGGMGVGTMWEVRAWDEIYRRVPVLGEWL